MKIETAMSFHAASRCIIACPTIENELRQAMEHTKCSAPVIWLEPMLHSVPKQLNASLQNALDGITGYSTVLLAMSFCGNSIAGIQTGNHHLVVPRCGDCIDLLLGDVQRPGDSLFFTEGWVQGDGHIGCEYDRCLEKYGEKRGKRIMAAMLAHYHTLSMVDTGSFNTAATGQALQGIADKLGLQYQVLPGSLRLLEKLLTGPWDEHFLVVPPNSPIPETAIR